MLINVYCHTCKKTTKHDQNQKLATCLECGHVIVAKAKD